MSKAPSPLRIGFVAVFGAMVGLALQALPLSISLPSFLLLRARKALPSPHCVPRFPEQTTLRYGMIHDLMVGRDFPHSEAWWLETLRIYENRALQIRDDSITPEAAIHEAVELTAAAYDKLHRSQEAVDLVRSQQKRLSSEEKSALDGLPSWPRFDWTQIRTAQQRFNGLSAEKDRIYRLWANLGTFLIHHSFAAARKGDTAARAELREGLDLIERSVRLNPLAHFGREIWQIVFVRHFLACLDEPPLLLQYSGLGIPIKSGFDAESEKSGTINIPSSLEAALAQFAIDPNSAFEPFEEGSSELARANIRKIQFTQMHLWRTDSSGSSASKGPGASSESAFYGVEWLERNAPNDLNLALVAPFLLNRVGADSTWNMATGNILPFPVPYDEPCLAMIGMWTQGGGPNPHFALAFGQIMQFNGQFDLALECYERARLLGDRFSPEADQNKRFVEALDAIQEDLAATAKWSKGELIQRRLDFAEELAEGLKLRDSFHELEASRIKAGAKFEEIDKALDDFLAANPRAVSHGQDLIDIRRIPNFDFPELLLLLPGMLLFGGALAWIASFSKG